MCSSRWIKGLDGIRPRTSQLIIVSWKTPIFSASSRIRRPWSILQALRCSPKLLGFSGYSGQKICFGSGVFRVRDFSIKCNAWLSVRLPDRRRPRMHLHPGRYPALQGAHQRTAPGSDRHPRRGPRRPLQGVGRPRRRRAVVGDPGAGQPGPRGSAPALRRQWSTLKQRQRHDPRQRPHVAQADREILRGGRRGAPPAGDDHRPAGFFGAGLYPHPESGPHHRRPGIFREHSPTAHQRSDPVSLPGSGRAIIF